MGCDIHIYTEKREGGRWVTADKWGIDKYSEPGDPKSVVPEEIFEGRNYNLFAILADVRNGRGFAGIRTGSGFNPICSPKGLPEDVCAEVKAKSEQWGGDGHSHSFLTVAEIMAFDWTQTSVLSGVLNGVEFAEWSRWRRERGDGPESYAGAVMGRDIRHVSVAEMDKLVKEANETTKDMSDMRARDAEMQTRLGNYVTEVEWRLPYYKCSDTFLSQTLPRLWRLGAPEDVRLVFWFDS